MSGQPLQVICGEAGAAPLLLAPANGFPPECYAPTLAPLGRDWRALSLPPRGMWPGIGAAPEEPGCWAELAEDLLAGMAHHALRGVVGVGHSFGAAVLLRAALREPMRFRALALLDPALLPEARLQGLRELRARCPQALKQAPLAQGALTRRHRFPDVETAFRYWRTKPLFADWSDGALWAYTRSMTQRARGGAGLELAWRRDWEAWYYMSVDTEAWEALARLKGRQPTLIVQGAESEVFPRDSLQRAGALLPTATLATLPGGGHLFPNSHPEATTQVLAGWLAGLR